MRRSSILGAIFCEIARAAGNVNPVLVEEKNKEPGYVSGRISQNLTVHFQGSGELIGQIVPVKLKECKGFYYFGELTKA